MKKRNPLTAKRSLAVLLKSSLRTGDHCSSSGWWAPEADRASARFISEGSVMPAHQGVAVNWLRMAMEAPAPTH